MDLQEISKRDSGRLKKEISVDRGRRSPVEQRIHATYHKGRIAGEKGRQARNQAGIWLEFTGENLVEPFLIGIRNFKRTGAVSLTSIMLFAGRQAIRAQARVLSALPYQNIHSVCDCSPAKHLPTPIF